MKLGSVLLTFFLSFASGNSQCFSEKSNVLGHSVKYCTSGWVRYGREKCFKVFTDKKTHKEANDICKQHEGTLASINSKDEHQFLSSYALNEVKTSDLIHIWVGGTKYGNFWIWKDNKPFVYTDWYAGHPVKDENCLRIVTHNWHLTNDVKENFGKFGSFNCSTATQYICQTYQADRWEVYYIRAI